MKHMKAAAVVAGIIMALGSAAPAVADSGAYGYTADSPGLLSGNLVQIPIHAPIHACGNSINVIGLLNPAGGTYCGSA
ncbi:chaplin [Streptomyces sp. NPDC006283]|uniref:chaplin n=1 Tax=Streptomyces sp. NPDC006283 TaxID=3156741 RepID=UPI0033B92F8F